MAEIHLTLKLVTSLVEVWIEMFRQVRGRRKETVTSLVEVWIEINKGDFFMPSNKSLPLWKCGLKYPACSSSKTGHRHFPCGSVD